MGAFKTSEWTVNGSLKDDQQFTIKTMNEAKLIPTPQDFSEDDFAVLALRNFLFDICNQNGGGHGGSALGMAAIGVALYKYIMRYSPSNSEWFDRDRFVLSNGENSPLQAKTP